jgi:hypothetical protein
MTDLPRSPGAMTDEPVASDAGALVAVTSSQEIVP